MKLILALAGILILAAVGCSDDSPTGTRPFQVVVAVTDDTGAPVEGLELNVLPHLPEFYQRADTVKPPQETILDLPFPSPSYPVVAIQFRLGEPAFTRLSVEDVAGNEVRLVRSESLMPGVHQSRWNGQDDAGRSLPAGVYYARIGLSEVAGGETHFEQRQPMLFAPFLPNQYLVGTTDADGRIVIEDDRLFPHLYGVTEIPAVDLDGVVAGVMELGPTMRFNFVDPGSGEFVGVERDVPGTTTLQILWNPESR